MERQRNTIKERRRPGEKPGDSELDDRDKKTVLLELELQKCQDAAGVITLKRLALKAARRR